MAGFKIIGYGDSHGERIVTNHDLEQIMDTSDEWIRQKTGIERRYFAEHRSNLDMACEAAQKALSHAAENKYTKNSDNDNASCKNDENAIAKEIDLVLVCTFTPDLATPSVSCGVAGRLGISDKALCLDINGACSGFIYGCTLANSMLASGTAHKALVIGSEKISPLMDMGDRGTAILFGDGAGALILEHDPAGEFVSVCGNAPDDEVLCCERFDPAIQMRGQEVYRFATTAVPENIGDLLEAAGRSADDVDWFVLHQANGRILRSIAGKLKQDKSKFYKNIEEYGNTSAASVAICISRMLTEGHLQPGQTVVSSGFGAGLTYGSMLFKV